MRKLSTSNKMSPAENVSSLNKNQTSAQQAEIRGSSGNSGQSSSQVQTQDLLLFENLVVNCFSSTALHSADKFSNGQQIFGLT